MIVIYPNAEAARGKRYPESVTHLLHAVTGELKRDRKRSAEVAFLWPARRLPSGTMVDPSGMRFRMSLISNDRPYRGITAELKAGEPVMTVWDQIELDRHAIGEAARFLEQQSLASKIVDEIEPGVYRRRQPREPLRRHRARPARDLEEIEGCVPARWQKAAAREDARSKRTQTVNKRTEKQKPAAMVLIETTAQAYAVARADLAATAAALNDEIADVKKKYLVRIRKEVAEVKERHAFLKHAIEASPELFEKPRTQIFHGVRVGFRKGEGKVTFESPDKVLQLIEKHLPEQADLLIIIERKPNKEAIAQLPAAEVKRIGCSIVGTSDLVVIKDTASDVDKLVEGLLKENIEEAA